MAFYEEFSRIVTNRFEMSMMGELKFFLGFQIKQLKDGTFISQTKYTNDMLKKFDKDKAKPIKIPMPTNGHLDLDQGGKDVNQKVYCSMIGSVAPGFKDKTRYTLYESPGSQISHIATNKVNIKRQYSLHNVNVLVKGK